MENVSPCFCEHCLHRLASLLLRDHSSRGEMEIWILHQLRNAMSKVEAESAYPSSVSPIAGLSVSELKRRETGGERKSKDFSRHMVENALSCLLSKGLINCQTVGRARIYTLTSDGMYVIEMILAGHC